MKQPAPLVSVIMPVYNTDRYLARAIQSILNQTFANFELFIIDDGSTDKTAKIVRGFARKDKRIKVITNSRNRGMGPSINQALPLTRGKYIARMDADDIALPHRFAAQIAFLEKNPRVVACGGHVMVIDEAGKTTGTKRFPLTTHACYETMLLMMSIQSPTLMARGDIMRKCRYEEYGLGVNDDIAVHFQLMQYGQFNNVDDTILKYRVHDTSVTHSDVKAAFRMAFAARIKALLYQRYRPQLKTIALFGLETIVVTILPNATIKWLFELFRHKNTDSFLPSLRAHAKQSQKQRLPRLRQLADPHNDKGTVITTRTRSLTNL